MLTGAALYLHRLAERRRSADAVVFFALLAMVVLTRSAFHLLWFAFGLALALLAVAGARRRILLAALTPLLLVVGVYAKNWVVFGTPTTSSWLGMNLAKLTVERIPLAERRELVRRGQLSSLALIEPFSALQRYPLAYRGAKATDVPVLREPVRSSGFNNFNHRAYLRISLIYLDDAGHVLRRNPGRYLAALPSAWLRFFAPPTGYKFVVENLSSIARLDRTYAAVLYGVPSAWRSPPPRANPGPAMHAGYLWMAASIAGVAFALVAGVRDVRRRQADPSRAVTLLFAAGTVLYVVLVVNSLEIGENNRFRMMVEPLLFALVTWGLAELARKLRPSSSRR